MVDRSLRDHSAAPLDPGESYRGINTLILWDAADRRLRRSDLNHQAVQKRGDRGDFQRPGQERLADARHIAGGNGLDMGTGGGRLLPLISAPYRAPYRKTSSSRP